jgi:anti-sigma regulatory factor (Ser/Thr protein kinase)
VLAEAAAAGLTQDRVTDVVLAVHELAANAVRHGDGAGRLRMHAAGGELHCQVSDAGPGGRAGRAVSATSVRQWKIQPGHGLWLVRDIADRLSIAPGPAGSAVTAVFALQEQGTAAGHGISGEQSTSGEHGISREQGGS